MGLVRNLKKTLTNLAEKILLELSYHYIKQRARQTMKRQDNSSSTMSSQNPLTQKDQRSTIATSSQGTSEKITMETQIDPVVQVRDWSIERIDKLSEGDIQSRRNALAIIQEFEEWINIPEGQDEINYLCIEEDGWGDQEVDVK